jgi:tetratricopeptide (TPR) repeat protein
MCSPDKDVSNQRVSKSDLGWLLMNLRRWESRRIGQLLVAACLSSMLSAIVPAQNPNPSSDSALTRQLHQALALAKQGDGQGAMKLALQLLQQNPRFVPALKLKGTLLEESGQTSEAAASFEEALKLSPNDADLLLKSGIYKLAMGDRDEAIKRLKHCTKLLPGDGDAQYYLAQAYHLNGQDELALSAIRQSLKIEPDNPSVLQKYGELLCSTGDCQAGLRSLLKARQSDATLPHIDFDIAVTHFKLMDLPNSAKYAERAVQARPNDIEALQLLATVDVKLAHWPEAKVAYEQLQMLKPGDVETLLGLGQCELELKNYQAAIDRLQSALQLDPTRVQAHFYLSRAFAALDRPAAAQHEAELHQLMMQQLTFARSLESEQREGAIKAQVQQLLAANREEAAIHLYQEHFKGTPMTLADAYVFIGKIELLMGKTDDGLRSLHHALNIQPTVRGAHTNEGILALKFGDLNRAEEQFHKELANDPNYQMAIAEMGEVRYRQERWSEAAELLAKSKTITPELLYMLCDSYFRLGKVQEANLNAEAAAAYARNRPEMVQSLAELLTRNGQADLAKRLGTSSRSN